jgi:hypothetical protein
MVGGDAQAPHLSSGEPACLDAESVRETQRGAQQQQALALVNNVERFVEGLSGDVAVQSGTAPKLKDGVSISAAVEQERAKLELLKSELKDWRARPHKSGTVKAKLRAKLQALAERGQPAVEQNILHGRTDISWPTLQVAVPITAAGNTPTGSVEIGGKGANVPGGPVEVRGVAHVAVPDTVAILAAALGPQLQAMLDSAIDAIADDANALDDVERAKGERDYDLLAKILEAERSHAVFKQRSLATRRSRRRP